MPDKDFEQAIERIREHLAFLYGPEKAPALTARLHGILCDFLQQVLFSGARAEQQHP